MRSYMFTALYTVDKMIYFLVEHIGSIIELGFFRCELAVGDSKQLKISAVLQTDTALCTDKVNIRFGNKDVLPALFFFHSVK